MEPQAPILGALIEVIPQPGEDNFDGDPGAFTNFWARAADAETLRQLADAAFATMGLQVVDIEDVVVIVDIEGDQPAEAKEALARISNGAPWAHSTFHVYPASE